MGEGAEDQETARAEAPPRAARPSAVGIALCAALAFANALASLFQWMQLVLARTGGDPLYGLGEVHGLACARVHDSALATSVQTISGMPIAGWGLVFSLVAFAFPLWALARAHVGDRAGSAAVWPAVLVTALAGLAVSALLLVTSVREGAVCATCAVTYALVFSYAVIALLESPRSAFASLFRGVSWASAAVGLAYVLLFIPGLLTPERGDTRYRYLNRLPTSPEIEAATAASNARAIESVIRQLRGKRARDFASALAAYREAQTIELGAPRALIGASNAPVRITQFTDMRCPRCATFYSTLARVRTGVPPRSFSIEPRYWPNDAGCNPEVEGEPGEGIRCLGARVQICLEGAPDAMDLAASLYRHGRTLDEEGVYALAAPMIPREELEACVNAPGTEAKLQADIALAAAFEFDEPPLVLLNGRRVYGLGPLLFTLILAQGDPYHPAFEGIPAEAFAPLPEPEAAEGAAEGEGALETAEGGAASGDAGADGGSDATRAE